MPTFRVPPDRPGPRPVRSPFTVLDGPPLRIDRYREDDDAPSTARQRRDEREGDPSSPAVPAKVQPHDPVDAALDLARSLMAERARVSPQERVLDEILARGGPGSLPHDLRDP